MTVTSPDVSQYVDLTLYDADPSTLYQRMVLNAQQLLPGWQPDTALPEVAIAQSLALVIAELVFAVNRLPGATVQTLLQLFGIVRGTGTAASGSVTFGSVGQVTVPAGTQLLVQSGSDTWLFATGTAVTFTGTTTVAATCTQNAAAANGIPAGTALTVLGSFPLLTDATFSTVTAGGVDPETSTAWLSRGAQQLQSQTSALVLAAQFTAAALADTSQGVYRALTTSNWDPTLNGGAGGSAQGVVTVSAMGQAGVLLTSGQQAALQASLAASAMAGLAVHVVSPTVTSIPVTVTVWQEPGWTVSQVQENVAAALAATGSPTDGTAPGAGLSTDLWPFTTPGGEPNNTVRINDIIAAITAAPGVAFVDTLTAPAANVALPGIAPLPSLGAVTVTVEGP